MLGAWRGVEGWGPALLVRRKIRILGQPIRSPLRLVLDVTEDGIVGFGFWADGLEFTDLKADVGLSGRFSPGARVGVVAFANLHESREHADFDYFRFSGAGEC
jgi:hypothetical protein